MQIKYTLYLLEQSGTQYCGYSCHVSINILIEAQQEPKIKSLVQILVLDTPTRAGQPLH